MRETEMPAEGQCIQADLRAIAAGPNPVRSPEAVPVDVLAGAAQVVRPAKSSHRTNQKVTSCHAR